MGRVGAKHTPPERRATVYRPDAEKPPRPCAGVLRPYGRRGWPLHMDSRPSMDLPGERVWRRREWNPGSRSLEGSGSLVMPSRYGLRGRRMYWHGTPAQDRQVLGAVPLRVACNRTRSHEDPPQPGAAEAAEGAVPAVLSTLALALPKDIGTMCAPAQCQWVWRVIFPACLAPTRRRCEGRGALVPDHRVTDHRSPP